jgi:DNA-binding transcriptional LysR family regulator
VVDLGTIAKAASLLSVNPGALSRAMRALELELGFALFVHVGRNIVPTNKARQLHGKLRPWLESFAANIRDLRESKSDKLSIRIGSFEVFTSHVAAQLIADALPSESFLLRELTPGAIEAAVARAEIDWGLTYVPVPCPGVDFVELARFRMAVFVRRGAFERVALEDLPFAVPTTPLGTNTLNVDALDAWPTGMARTVRYRFELLETALALAMRGRCAIHAPDFVIRAYNHLLPRESQLVAYAGAADALRSPTFSIYLVKRTVAEESKEIRRLCSHLGRLCRGRPTRSGRT